MVRTLTSASSARRRIERSSRPFASTRARAASRIARLLRRRARESGTEEPGSSGATSDAGRSAGGGFGEGLDLEVLLEPGDAHLAADARLLVAAERRIGGVP